MKRPSSTFVSLLTCLSLGACGYREGPPVQAPSSAIPPAVAAIVAAAPADRPVVVLEANGDAAKVSEVFTTSAGASNRTFAVAETLKPLCITPCRVDLSPGLHELRFSSRKDNRVGSVDLTVDDRSKVVRHSMGKTDGSHGGMLAGVLLTSLGGSFMLAGVGTAGNTRDDKEQRDLGVAAMSLGAVTLVLGVVVMAVSRPVRRPETTTEIQLPRRAPSTTRATQPAPAAADEEGARRTSNEARGAPPP